jgi:hypothetical protein
MYVPVVNLDDEEWQFPPELSIPTIKLQSILISEKTTIGVFTAMKTANLT